MSERPKLQTVTHGLKTFALPFAELFRPLTAAEDAALRASARAVGIGHPVFTYDSDTFGRDCVIDGANRLRIASEEELDIRIEKLRVTDEVARTLAEDLNAVRRQVTPQEAKEARARRIGQVAEMRQAGQSLRAIAAEVGVSVPQVRRDLEEAGVTSAQVPTVTGVDGKVYRAPTAHLTTDEPDRRADGTPDEPDRGDAWEPEDDEDDGGELADDGDDADPDGEVDESLPVPAFDASRPRRPGKPPKPIDKDHPYYDVLMKFTALNAAITKVLRADKGKELVEAMRDAQKGTHHLPFLFFTSDQYVRGEIKSQTVKFVGLHAMRTLIRKVGEWKGKGKPGRAAKVYQAALEVAKNGGRRD